MDNKEFSLNIANIGVDYIISNLDSNLSFYEKERLLSHGFINGNKIKIVRKSLFKQTLQIQIDNCNLVIRKKESKKIYLKHDTKINEH